MLSTIRKIGLTGESLIPLRWVSPIHPGLYSSRIVALSSTDKMLRFYFIAENTGIAELSSFFSSSLRPLCPQRLAMSSAVRYVLSGLCVLCGEIGLPTLRRGINRNIAAYPMRQQEKSSKDLGTQAVTSTVAIPQGPL